MSSREDLPRDLVIHERIGDLLLSLDGDRIMVTPSNAFKNAIAERMGRAASARNQPGLVDRFDARKRGDVDAKLDHFFGAFPITEAAVELIDGRLHLRVGKVRTSFSPLSFDMSQALDFVRQLDKAKEEDGV